MRDLGEVVTQEQIADIRHMAQECAQLAEAFRVTSSDRDVIPIPRRMCARMCEVLAELSQAMLSMVEKIQPPSEGNGR